MADGSLIAALQQVQLAADSIAGNDDWIDELLDQEKPRKRRTKSPTGVKAQLEHEYLTPPTQFSTEWLNRLQKRWDEPLDHSGLFGIAPTQTRTALRFTREGLEGRVTGYTEVTVAASTATAKTSTSLLRKPANRADFVRGAAGYLPFTPGGLDGVEAAAAAEETLIRAERQRFDDERPRNLDQLLDIGSGGGLLEAAPGFKRGLRSEVGARQGVSVTEDLLEAGDDGERELGHPSKPEHGEDQAGGESATDARSVEGGEEVEDIDSILPVEFPALQPHRPLATSMARERRKQWAHVINVNRPMTNFSELVPNMAKQWPFELDTFQREAVYHLEKGDSVFIAAHTSAGKTVVAEYAIALAAKHMTKAIYTSPIKALSNQKFRDFRNSFEEVGILTGDVQINPEASCLIMTTEILRSMLYRGADLIRDVEFVIFDEVHYVNDLERGVVWEEVIIMLPEHVSLILLSATVPNTLEFASWVGRTKKKDIYVISTAKRPVPLEHYLWAGKAMYRIVDANKAFNEKAWKEAHDILSGKDKIKNAVTQSPAERGHRGGHSSSRGQPQRGGAQQRGRGQPQRGGSALASSNRGRPGGMRTTAAQDRNIWVHLVQHLRKSDLLPACIFVFSKRRCEENADALSNLDYCTATEKSAIHMTFQRSIARLKPEDRMLPQIRRIRELLGRGIAVHHGGLLPIVKEVVEILFAKTLVKVLFATETFAMGLNLPTRTVVFSGFRKHDGRSFRDLTPGEYTQMAGRAGRRGLDPVGSVIIVAPGSDEAPPVATLRNMILGDPTKLRSQFRLTYNMILNLLRVEALKIEDMIKRSFSENATQALLPEHEKQMKISEADLAKIKREPCQICDADIVECHDAAMRYKALSADMHLRLMASPAGKRMFSPKRLIVYMKDGVRVPAILLREGISSGHLPTLQVLDCLPHRAKRDDSDLLPNLPAFRKLFPQHPTKDVGFKPSTAPLRDVECVTQTILKISVSGVCNGQADAVDEANAELLRVCASWADPAWDELDWSRIKDIHVRDMLDARAKAAAEAQDRCCVQCPQFLKHFGMRHDEWTVQENIIQIRQLMSDQNLQLLPDYEQRVAVLKDLEFIDGISRVLLKGKVACEIHSADELVLTELILENVLADFEPEEIVALLSAFVFQEKTDQSPVMTPKLEKGRDTIVSIAERVNAFQIQHQVILSSADSNDFVSRPRFGLVEVVYEWARGMSFHLITDLTDVLEGTIVRTITRLDETCREVKNAARIIGDPALFTKMQTCQEMIKRDITAVASLYM